MTNKAEWKSLNTEAMSLYHAGDYSREVVLAQDALKLADTSVGPKNPDVTVNPNHLGMLYIALGKYADADPLYQRAWAITENAVGPVHRSVAVIINNIAELYQMQALYSDFLLLHPLLIYQKEAVK